MTFFVIVMGVAIVALLGYLGYAINEAYLQGLEKGVGIGYRQCYKDNFSDIDMINLEDDGK